MLSFLVKPFIWAHQNPAVNRFFTALDFIIASMNKSVAVLGIVIGVLITAINVILRTLGSLYPDIHSLTWAEEAARYCFIWSALFGAAYGFRKGVHISVMMLVEKFPHKIAKACMLCSYFLSALYLAFMCYAGIDVVFLNYEMGIHNEAIHGFPLWYFLLCLPIAFLGATYRVIEKFYEVCFMDARDVVKNTQSEIIHDITIKE